ncbi:unnamed protein product [Lampetra fluviatilis]
MALNDEALAIFTPILPERTITLQAARHKMAKIFDPPSNAKRKFQQGRREEAKAPLAYLSVLMALGQAAYPRLEEAVMDSLVMEKMLALVQEMAVVLPLMEEEAQTSSWVARCLWIQEEMSWQTRVVSRAEERPETISCACCPGC